MRDGTRQARGFSISLTSQGWRGNAGQTSCCKTRFPVPAQTPPACPWHKEKQWCKRSGSQWKFPAHSSVSNRSPPAFPVQWVATHPCPGAICAPRSTHGMGWNLARFCLLSDSLPLLWKADMLPVDTTELLTPGLRQHNEDWQDVAGLKLQVHMCNGRNTSYL